MEFLAMRTFRTTLLFLVAACVLALGSSVFGQPPAGGPPFGGGPGGPPGGPGGFFGGGGIAGILQIPEVQKEVELTDDQKTELGKLRTEIRDQIRNQFNGMRDMTDEERQARMEQIRGQMDTIRKDVEGKLQKVLLPNQFDRLKQIDLQSRIQREGAAALAQGELADQLGLTDAQREQLQQKSAQVQQDLQAKIRQARLDARSQLLDVLTTDQRAKLESLMGTQFDLPEPNFNPNGGQAGNRGGGRLGRGGRGGRNGDGAPPATPATPNSTN
jgi:Spy/CpxP family protein refolding chaperone